MVLLSSSTPEGVCYIETMNLDGETNLKIKKGMEDTWEFTEDKLGRFKGSAIECEQPNNSLYTFVGNLLLAQRSGPPLKLALSPTQARFCGGSRGAA